MQAELGHIDGPMGCLPLGDEATDKDSEGSADESGHGVAFWKTDAEDSGARMLKMFLSNRARGDFRGLLPYLLRDTPPHYGRQSAPSSRPAFDLVSPAGSRRQLYCPFLNWV